MEIKYKISSQDLYDIRKAVDRRVIHIKQLETAAFWGVHLWSHSYYMSTLGNMSRDVVEKYIRDQYSK